MATLDTIKSDVAVVENFSRLLRAKPSFLARVVRRTLAVTWVSRNNVST